MLHARWHYWPRIIGLGCGYIFCGLCFVGCILDWALWVVAANGEGQRKYLEDSGQNSWPEQLEGNVQPDAFPVEEETQARWMLVNWVLINDQCSRLPREGGPWERGKELEYEQATAAVFVFPDGNASNALS